MEASLLALVFLGMVLRKGQDTQKRTKRNKNKKPRADCKSAQKKNIEIAIYMMLEQEKKKMS